MAAQEDQSRWPTRRWVCGGLGVCCLLLAGFIVWPVAAETWAIHSIRGLGGKIETAPGGPRWLRKRIGNSWMKVFDRVERVEIPDPQSVERFRPYLERLRSPVRLVITSRWFEAAYYSKEDLRSRLSSQYARALFDANPLLINSSTTSLETPLLIAVRHSDVEMVRFLLERGADPNLESYYQYTPLHAAHHPEIVRLLARHGADLEAELFEGDTVLDVMTSAWFYSRDDSPRSRLRREAIDALLAAGARPDIRCACRLQDLEMARPLVRERESAEDHVALRDAAITGNMAMVKLLLDHSANAGAVVEDRTVYGPETAVAYAIPHADVVELFLSRGANPNAQARSMGNRKPGASLLHDAAGRGADECCRVLLKYGAAINALDPDGRTPLHWAVESRHESTVKLLLDHGANAAIEDKDHDRPLTYTVNDFGARQNEKDNAAVQAIIKLLSH